MPWVNLDENFPEHPKNDSLTDGAFRLHVAGICYCNRQLTDGLIAADKVARLVPRFRQKALDELIDRGLWIRLDTIQCYEIHDFLQWNRSRGEIKEHQERINRVRSEAGKKGAAARWQTG
jgi:hypothetical protein